MEKYQIQYKYIKGIKNILKNMIKFNIDIFIIEKEYFNLIDEYLRLIKPSINKVLNFDYDIWIQHYITTKNTKFYSTQIINDNIYNSLLINFNDLIFSSKEFNDKEKDYLNFVIFKNLIKNI